MKKKKGTTLIEVLLYTIIAAFFVTSISIFAWNAISAKNKNDSLSTVNDAIQVATEEITKAIRNADSILSPANRGESSNTLTLSYPDGSSKTFSLNSGTINMQTNNQNYQITPDQVVVEDLSFTNLGRQSTPGLISIRLKIARKNLDNLSELEAENEINISESLRE